MQRILGEVCKTYGWVLHAIEVMPDHVHLFVQADHTTAPVEIAKTMKSISAVHIFNTFKDLKKRRFWGSGMWSDGTFYSSVGGVSEEAIRRYIETQKQRGDSLTRKENACIRGHRSLLPRSGTPLCKPRLHPHPQGDGDVSAFNKKSATRTKGRQVRLLLLLLQSHPRPSRDDSLL
jgi:putative transposase